MRVFFRIPRLFSIGFCALFFAFPALRNRCSQDAAQSVMSELCIFMSGRCLDFPAWVMYNHGRFGEGICFPERSASFGNQN